MSNKLPPLPDVTGALLHAEAGLAAFAADPIKAFRFKSEGQRNFAKALSIFEETALRSGNQFGKTTIGANCGVALSRGCHELDGVRLPMLGTPNEGVVLAKGRAMAKLSVIKAYRKAVGNWPHHFEKNGNSIEAIWVKPNSSRSDDWSDWSCIRFFVEGGQDVAGMRLDWIHADEPPDMEIWSELRMRHQANRRLVRFITFTPIDRREWLPLKIDFKGCAWPKGNDGKVEIVGSVFENKALGAAHLKELERSSRGLLQKAKLFGEYVDTTGANPFDAEGLGRWSERCVDPSGIDKWTTSRGGVHEWQWWDEPIEGEQYMAVADPSSGIEDEAGAHDPCEVAVVSRGVKGRPAVVARYNGYIPAYELGRLSTHLAKRYNQALLVWERNSGYGEAFYLGVGDYGNIYIEHHRDSLHMPLSERIGWTTTATTRGTIIGALQKAILEDGLLVLSADAIENLKGVVVKRDGIRIEAGAGYHDEDMIVLGLACHLLETYPLHIPKTSQKEQLVTALGGRFRTPTERDPFALA